MPIREATKIQVAKWLDDRLGPAAVRLVRRLPRRKRRSVADAGAGKILFVKFWGLGSIVLSEPAVRRLRERFPGAEVHYLTLERNRALFALLPGVDRVWTLPFGTLSGFLFQLAVLLVRLRREAYDAVFDGEFFVNFSGLVGWLSGAPRIVGFARPGAAKRRLQDIAVPFGGDLHTARQFLNLIEETASRDKVPPRPRLRDPEAACGPMVGAGRPYLALNINASPLALERRWELERFVELGTFLLRRFEFDLILIGCPAEREYVAVAERLLDCPGRVRNLCGALNLAQLAWWLRGAFALISNDSGPVHLASAYDVPTVAFYGPETPMRYGPLSLRRLVFYERLWCSPCMSVENAKTVRCVNGLACMKKIDAERVIRAVAVFLSELPAETTLSECAKTGTGR